MNEPRQIQGLVANVMDFGAWAEGSLFRNVDSEGNVTYDSSPNEARMKLTGNSHHDDTNAIQAAMDHVASLGGGTVYFPFPGNIKRFYRIDGPAYRYYDPVANSATNSPTREENGKTVENWPLKSQIYIPVNGYVPGNYPSSSNIMLLGEVPPSSLKDYRVPDGKNNFGFRSDGFFSRNSVLRSSVDVDEKVGYEDRPWSVIAAPEGTVPGSMNRVPSSLEMFSVKNLEIQVHFEYNNAQGTPRLYPTMGAVNLMNVRRMHVEDCFFGLDNEVATNYDSYQDQKTGKTKYYATRGRCLQKSPTTTVGLFGAIEDCAEQKIVNLTVQGFKFGIVIPEMTNANFVHVSDCEYALSFLDATHVSVIEQLSTHNNRRCICVLPIPRPIWKDGKTVRYPRPFGCEIRYEAWNAEAPDKRNAIRGYKPQVNVRILAHDYEHGHFTKPFVTQMRWGIWDPQDRLFGTVVYHQGFPGDRNAASLNIQGGRDRNDPIYEGNETYYEMDRQAKSFYVNHSFYDHRDGGERGFRFRNDVFEKDEYGTEENGIETDVANWMEDDWKLEGYDFVAWNGDSGIDPSTGCRKKVDPDDKRIISSSEYFKASLSLPPCPGIGGTKYSTREYGSYYPVLGATGTMIRELSELGSGIASELSMSEGHAMRKCDDNGALVFSGGTEYGNGNSTLTLFGSKHGANPGSFAIAARGSNGAGAGLVGTASTLSWGGTSVSGGAFAAAGMPALGIGFDLRQVKFLLSGKESSASQPYSSTGYRYQANVLKAGWLVFFGKIGSGSSITTVVRGTNGDPIYANTTQGAQAEVGFSVPCPAGSVLETWISGNSQKNLSNSTLRFVPCVSEAVGKTLSLSGTNGVLGEFRLKS